jgi:hypothetical protein
MLQDENGRDKAINDEANSPYWTLQAMAVAAQTSE